MNIFTFSINLCCLLFWEILVIVYFSKKNMSNIENKLYRFIIIMDFLVLIFHFLGLIAAYYIPKNDNLFLIYEILGILYCVAEGIWCMFFASYAIIIINENNDKFKNIFQKYQKKITAFFVIITILISLIIGILPVKYDYTDTNIIIYNGPRIDFMTIFLIILGFAGVVSIILNIKDINAKKISPFLLFIILQVLALFFYMIDPSISIFTLAITLISYLMYHTIENPDIKMIAQLEFAKTQAEKSNKVKSDFLNSMTQEIINPLNIIVDNSKIIMNTKNKNEMRLDSRKILLASENLMEIIDGILDMNKLEANKMEIVNKKYNLQQELEPVIKAMKIRIGEKPVDLVTYYADNLPQKLSGDIEKIKQIVTNLLTNAIKYTDKGFIYFNIISKNNRDKCEITISVRDTGRGIEKEKLDKIINKFNHTNNMNSNIEETGLGLTIVNSLVELFDGSIDVTSIYGQGSTFTITFKQDVVN